MLNCTNILMEGRIVLLLSIVLFFIDTGFLPIYSILKNHQNVWFKLRSIWNTDSDLWYIYIHFCKHEYGVHGHIENLNFMILMESILYYYY